MATFDLPILGFATNLDSGVYPSRVVDQLTLTTASGSGVGRELVYVLPDPNGSGDWGIHGSFRVPQNYVSTPVIAISSLLDGLPSGVSVAFGIKMNTITDNELYDVAYSTENTASNSTWTGYADEEHYEETIPISTPASFSPGDEVNYWFYIDDDVHGFTGQILLRGLYFRYNDS